MKLSEYKERIRDRGDKMFSIYIEQAGYEEKQTVIKNVQFTLKKGELVGLIGSNGAGKSTTIQAMIGTLPHVKGEITLPAFGYVPERPMLYEHFTLEEHIRFLIETLDGDQSQVYERAIALCERFRLADKLHTYPTTFSKGMQQKVMIVLAFAPQYELYIVDEPFMGLDPQAMRQFILLLQEVKAQNAAILMSTHALHTAEQICDRFILLHSGKVLEEGTLEHLQQGTVKSLLDLFDELIERAS